MMQLKNTILLIGLAAAALPATAADLVTVYKLAQRNDAQFRAEAATYAAEREQVPQSRGALLPQLDGQVSATEGTVETHESEFCGTVVQCEEDTESFGWTVTLRQSLYDHGNWQRLKQANALSARAEAEYQAARQALFLRVAEAYFGVLAAEDNLEFAEAETRAVGQQLEQARQRFEVGLIAITDVKESQAQYDQAQASEIQARNQLATAREALWTLTRTELDHLAPLGDNLPLLPPEPEDKQAWVDRALSENLSLLAARFQRDAADREVSVQRSGHYPSLGLVASRAYNDTEGGSFGGSEETTTRVGVELSIPLFSGGVTRSRVRESIHRLDAAREQLEFTRRRVTQRTRDAFQNTLADIARVRALAQALESSQAAYEATQAGFEVGTRNSVDVLIALRNTFAAERDYAQSRYDYLLDTLRLKQAVGSLGVSDLESINRWLK